MVHRSHGKEKDRNIQKCRPNGKFHKHITGKEGIAHDCKIENAHPLYLDRDDKHQKDLHLRINDGKRKENGDIDIIGTEHACSTVP